MKGKITQWKSLQGLGVVSFHEGNRKHAANFSRIDLMNKPSDPNADLTGMECEFQYGPGVHGVNEARKVRLI